MKKICLFLMVGNSIAYGAAGGEGALFLRGVKPRERTVIDDIRTAHAVIDAKISDLLTHDDLFKKVKKMRLRLPGFSVGQVDSLRHKFIKDYGKILQVDTLNIRYLFRIIMENLKGLLSDLLLLQAHREDRTINILEKMDFIIRAWNIYFENIGNIKAYCDEHFSNDEAIVSQFTKAESDGIAKRHQYLIEILNNYQDAVIDGIVNVIAIIENMEDVVSEEIIEANARFIELIDEYRSNVEDDEGDGIPSPRAGDKRLREEDEGSHNKRLRASKDKEEDKPQEGGEDIVRPVGFGDVGLG